MAGGGVVTVAVQLIKLTMTGMFTHDLVLVAGSYNYSKGGSGIFSGRIQP